MLLALTTFNLYVIYDIASERDILKAQLVTATSAIEKCEAAYCSDYGEFDSCNGERCTLIKPGKAPDYYCKRCSKFSCTQEQMTQ